MRKHFAKFLFFSPFLLLAQAPPTSQILKFPNIRLIQIGGAGGERCGIWFHSPTTSQIQIACYAQDGTLPKNEILNPPPTGTSGTFSFPDGTIAWLITNSTYQISARALGDTSDSFEKGTF